MGTSISLQKAIFSCLPVFVIEGHSREGEGKSQGLAAVGGLNSVHTDVPGPVMLGMYLTHAITSQPKDKECHWCWSITPKCKVNSGQEGQPR